VTSLTLGTIAKTSS